MQLKSVDGSMFELPLPKTWREAESGALLIEATAAAIFAGLRERVTPRASSNIKLTKIRAMPDIGKDWLRSAAMAIVAENPNIIDQNDQNQLGLVMGYARRHYVPICLVNSFAKQVRRV